MGYGNVRTPVGVEANPPVWKFFDNLEGRVPPRPILTHYRLLALGGTRLLKQVVTADAPSLQGLCVYHSLVYYL